MNKGPEASSNNDKGTNQRRFVPEVWRAFPMPGYYTSKLARRVAGGVAVIALVATVGQTIKCAISDSKTVSALHSQPITVPPADLDIDELPENSEAIQVIDPRTPVKLPVDDPEYNLNPWIEEDQPAPNELNICPNPEEQDGWQEMQNENYRLRIRRVK